MHVPSSGAAGVPRTLLLVVAYLGFVSLALPDAALGVAWPFLRADFALPQSGLGLVLAATGAGFFASSFAAGRLIETLGVGRLLAGSTAIVGVALVGIAAAPAFPVLLALAPLVGLGSGAIDAGLNAYAARRFSARHMTWLHAAFGLGAAIGPLLMTAAIVSSGSWRPGYAALAALMLAMALVFAATRGLWRADAGGAIAAEPTIRVPFAQAGAHPVVRLQVMIFALYAGVEVAAGAWGFTILSQARGLSVELAGIAVGLFWGGLFVGRLAFGAAADRIGIDRSVRIGFAGAVLAALLFAAAPALPASGPLAIVALGALGFLLAPIYPLLMLRTPQRLGDALAAHAIGFQVSAAMLGAILLPALGGVIADLAGLEGVPALILAATLVLLWLHARLARSDAG